MKKHFQIAPSQLRPSPKSKVWPPALVGLMLIMAILACSRPGQSEVIYVTATYPGGERVLSVSPTPREPSPTPINPTPNPTRDVTITALDAAPASITGETYTVQAGDSLAVIARSAGTTVDMLIALNNIANPDRIEVGQVLRLPEQSTDAATAPVPTAPITGPNFKILPDSAVVYSPTESDFDIIEYMKQKQGFLRVYSDESGGSYVSGVQMVLEVARNYSISPRLLLALLEYRGGWLNETSPSQQAQSYPMGLVNTNRAGLYRQLLDAADALNAGYYGWLYRGLGAISFQDGRSVTLAPDINAGTAAIQYFLSRSNTREKWLIDVGESGFFELYLSMFGDPFVNAFEPLVPSDIRQPVFAFPFPSKETWYFTGGPHGGYNSGSAWSSIDFAPPAPPDTLIAQQGYCYVSPFFATAVAPGVIARSGGGFVILDLDFDGNEHTGWTVVYLHLADNDALVRAGTSVQTGDRLGNPSCEGGFSTATHLHFGRRYNGQWMPVDCFQCSPDAPHAPMVLSGWTVGGFENAEYQGYMVNAAGERRRATQGRTDPQNQLSY